MTTNSFNHIAFACRDIAAQEAFYTKHFGFKRSRTFNAGQPNEFFMLKLGDVRLEMFSADKAKAAGQKGGEQPVGFKHLAFNVGNIDPIFAAIKAEGMDTDNILDFGSVRLLFFRDLEGNIIELMEGYKDENE
jgi:glyoxylase I family protein